MRSTREEAIHRLERFAQTQDRHKKNIIFWRPAPPESALATRLSNITLTADVDKLIQTFNREFTSQIDYLLQSTTTDAQESNLSWHSQAEAMGKLADKFGMSKAFNEACMNATETNLESIYLFQEQLRQAFAEPWFNNNQDLYASNILGLGFTEAYESMNLDRLTTIMSTAQKSMLLAFFIELNALMGNKMSKATLTSLIEQSTENSKDAVRETLRNILADRTNNYNPL